MRKYRLLTPVLYTTVLRNTDIRKLNSIISRTCSSTYKSIVFGEKTGLHLFIVIGFLSLKLSVKEKVVIASKATTINILA